MIPSCSQTSIMCATRVGPLAGSCDGDGWRNYQGWESSAGEFRALRFLALSRFSIEVHALLLPPWYLRGDSSSPHQMVKGPNRGHGLQFVPES
jgi:hypothetical protein